MEERLANLENSRAAVACSSGHASQQLVFATLLGKNDHFIASNKLYGGSINQFNKTFRNLAGTVLLSSLMRLKILKMK